MSSECLDGTACAYSRLSVGVMNVEGIMVRNITGNGVGLAGYLNCPQNLKWVGAQGNCTGLLLENVTFP